MTTLEEKEILKQWVKHPGTKLMAEKLRQIAKAAVKEQLRADPYVEPEKIMKAKQLIHIIRKVLPDMIEKYINYQEPVTKARWSILNLFKKF